MSVPLSWYVPFPALLLHHPQPYLKLSLEAPLHRAQLRVDPLSRCAALTLPQDALALLPFHSSQPELDADAARLRDIPYAPSYVLSLPALDTRLRGVRDAAFLPGLARPTLALLCAAGVLILALDPPAVLAAHEPLPGAFALAAAPAAVGGALVLAPGGAAHVGVSARRVALPPVPGLDLGGARCSFVGDDAALLVLRDGDARVLRLVMDGPTLVGLELGPSLGRTAVPAIVHPVGKSRVLVGSTAGDSVLLDVVRVEEEGAEMAVETEAAPKMDGMDLDDDAGSWIALVVDSKVADVTQTFTATHVLRLLPALPPQSIQPSTWNSQARYQGMARSCRWPSRSRRTGSVRPSLPCVHTA
jgi:cleavage and polyadenylation specificity factor subunit 1